MDFRPWKHCTAEEETGKFTLQSPGKQMWAGPLPSQNTGSRTLPIGTELLTKNNWEKIQITKWGHRCWQTIWSKSNMRSWWTNSQQTWNRRGPSYMIKNIEKPCIYRHPQWHEGLPPRLRSRAWRRLLPLCSTLCWRFKAVQGGKEWKERKE